MSITTLLDYPFYTGFGVTAEVPGRFPVAIDGHPYIVDLKGEQLYAAKRFHTEVIPLIRDQADQGNLPGEQSINPEELWRRAQETWHKGAGQVRLDRPESDSARFRSSKGIDPWTKWQMSLLPDTGQKRASANTNLALAVVGTRLYIIDGNKISYTTDVTPGTPTFTDLTGLPAANPTSIASDGFNVWTAHTASGIYAATRTGGATASYVTGTVTKVWYVKGRLMAANANSLYNVTAAGALPAALLTHANTDFTWVSLTEGEGQIYAAGYSGSTSLIYRIAVKADGSTLDAPIVAGELPRGETVSCIYGYLGFLLIGTDQGVRFAVADSAGDLRIGAVIKTSAQVDAFKGFGQYVWFSWKNYDATSTGLGRLDLTTFTDTDALVPAYASDLMVTGAGAVLSIAHFQSLTVFAISALGFYAEVTNKVSTGTIDSGILRYGLPDPKVALYTDLQMLSLPAGATVAVSLAADGGTFTLLGTQSTTATTAITYPVNQVRGSGFELREVLTRATDNTTGPTLTRHTLRAFPAPDRSLMYVVPILLYEEIQTNNGETVHMDVMAERDYLFSLLTVRRLVQYQEGLESHLVQLVDIEWQAHHQTRDKNYWNGTLIAHMKETVN